METTKIGKRHRFSFKLKLCLICIVPVILLCISLGALGLSGVIKTARTCEKTKLDVIKQNVDLLLLNDNIDTASEQIHELANSNDVIVSAFVDGTVQFSTNENFIGGEFVENQEALNLSYYSQDKTRYVSYCGENNNGYIIMISEKYDNYYDQIKNIQTMIFYVVIIFMVVVSIVVYSFCRKISKVITNVNNNLNTLADGNLKLIKNEKIFSRTDEFGEIYRNTFSLANKLYEVVNKLNFVAANLSTSSEELTTATEHCSSDIGCIDSSVGDVAQGATQQAQDCTNGTLTISDVNELVLSIVNKANSLEENTARVIEIQKVSLSSLEKLNINNNEINSIIEKARIQVSETLDAIVNVNNLVGRIKDISSQTNLLSLNASIEAAHAGDFGRGFAVVASEIGHLADESQQLTSDVTKIMENLNIKSKELSDSFDIIEQNSQIQSSTMNATSTDFNNLKTNINVISDSVGDILSSTETLQTKYNDLVMTFSGLSAISEENAAAAEECAATTTMLVEAIDNLSANAGKLNENKEHLLKEIAFFKIEK